MYIIHNSLTLLQLECCTDVPYLQKYKLQLSESTSIANTPGYKRLTYFWQYVHRQQLYLKKNPITFSSIHISVQHCFPRYQYYYREHQLLGQYVPNKTTKQQKINMTVIIHNSSFLVNYFYQHVESSHALHAYASFSSWVTLNLKRNKHKLNQTQHNF